MSKGNSLKYEFGRFVLVPDEKQLIRDGSPVQLTPKAFDMLVSLVENAGHLVTKEELLDRVWAGSFVEESNIPVKISELRRVLNDGDTVFIETVPRQGYRFLPDVNMLSMPRSRPELTRTETEPQPTESSEIAPQSRNRSWTVVAAALGVLVSLGLVVGLNVGGIRDELFESTEPAIAITSIAVLPLENLSGDTSQDYFAEGMTEALITELARSGDLKVISRASVVRYKGTDRSIKEIADELKVGAVLTGSVVRSGDRVRVSVLLVGAESERNLWAESYERDLRDVIDLQRTVTRDVVGRIRAKLGPADGMQATGYPTVVPEAYDDFLRGKFHLHRQTRTDNETAIASLEKAVAADPQFAEAYAELAQGYVWKLFLFDPGDERKWAEKAFVASEKAIALDPNLAVAYLSRGRLLWTPSNQFPHERVIKEYQKAIALDPNLDEARNQLSLVYNHIGAFDEALRELEQAVATNPGNSLAKFRIGQTVLYQGRYEEALNYLKGVPDDANPALVGHQIVWALFNLGRKDEASSALNRFKSDYPAENPSLVQSIEAVIAADAGRSAEAEEHIAAAIARGKGFGHFHHTAYHIAIAYAYMDRPGEAVRWLETAAETGFPCYPMFEQDRNLDNIRKQPAFTQFLERMKQKWEAYRSVIDGRS